MLEDSTNETETVAVRKQIVLSLKVELDAPKHVGDTCYRYILNK